ncbi:MAG: hypothetical protein KBG72_18135, partial [Agrobacterium sp.]|nr:hypothetical protein [Agrobacterium sp.]
ADCSSGNAACEKVAVRITIKNPKRSGAVFDKWLSPVEITLETFRTYVGMLPQVDVWLDRLFRSVPNKSHDE